MVPESQAGCFAPAVSQHLTRHPAQRWYSMKVGGRNEHKGLRNPTAPSSVGSGGHRVKAETHTQVEAARDPEPTLLSFLVETIKRKMPGYIERALSAYSMLCRASQMLGSYTH